MEQPAAADDAAAPLQVDNIASDALFILLVEKDAAFMRLAEDRWVGVHAGLRAAAGWWGAPTGFSARTRCLTRLDRPAALQVLQHLPLHHHHSQGPAGRRFQVRDPCCQQQLHCSSGPAWLLPPALPRRGGAISRALLPRSPRFPRGSGMPPIFPVPAGCSCAS